jgi:hypothetical protein
MSRSISQTATFSSHDQQTEEVWLILLTIEHPDIDPPIRVVNNNENVTSRGDEFIAFPFDIDLPGDDPDQMPKARLRIDNIDRQVVVALRSIDSPPAVTIEVILASDPDTVEIAFEGLTLRNAMYDAQTVTADLAFEAILAEPIAVTITPQRFPGLF